MRSSRTPLRLIAAAGLCLAVGCASGKQVVQTDREPVTDLGVGATVIMPGQSIPMGRFGGPGTGNLSSIGGASQQIDQRNVTNQEGGVDTLTEAAREVSKDENGETPLWQKAAAAPFVAAAYPFMKLNEAMQGSSEKGSSRTGGSGSQQSGQGGGSQSTRSSGAPAGGQAGGTIPGQATASQIPPQAAPAPRPADPNEWAEAARLAQMERELGLRGPAPGAATPAPQATGETLPWQEPQPAPSPSQAPAPGFTPPTAAAAPNRMAPAPNQLAAATPSRRPMTIAEELAALQATIAPRPRADDVARARQAPGTARKTEPAPTGLADRVRDRDGDGRPDLWSYHDANGQPTRELLDEDGDGSPDRTVWFEPETGNEARVEEDTNLDGRVDSWVEFKGGEVARQRRDRDYDGQLDTWTFYEAGVLARQEEDTSGDGFRNRVSFYDAGRLVREREDRDGDGRVDRLTVYDEGERPLRRDEDTDGDGRVDSRSIYENGRLVRRELVEALIDDGEGELQDTEWSSGPEDG